MAGAFGLVSSAHVLATLCSVGLHADLLGVISSWLQNRAAFGVVGGSKSQPMRLANMVFQGTVLGSALWNAFFGDSVAAVDASGFEVIISADDFNAFREYPMGTSAAVIDDDLADCQRQVHRWGSGNQVVFDAAKEHTAMFFPPRAAWQQYRLAWR